MKTELDFLVEQINEYKRTISPIKGINYDILNKYMDNARENYKLQNEANNDLNIEPISSGLKIRQAEKKKLYALYKVFNLNDLPDYERLEFLSTVERRSDVYYFNICPDYETPDLVSEWFLNNGCEYEEQVIIKVIP